MLLQIPRPVGASPSSLITSFGGMAVVSAGRDSSLLLWTIFWFMACMVAVAFVFSVAPPLRRGAFRILRQRPWLGVLAVLAYTSLFPTFLLGAGIFSESNVLLSMLIDGQGTMFVRGILFPGGRLSPAAVAVICIWLGFLVATGWIALTLLRNGPSSRSPPPFDSSREYRSARPRHWRRWFTIFTASALALVVLFAMRLYASQRVLERDMAANQACLRRYSKAEGSLAKSQLRRGDVSAILTDAAHASKLAEASALIGVRLNAAVEERNQRRSMLTYVVIGLATVWSLAAVGRIVPLLRRRRDRRETPSTGL